MVHLKIVFEDGLGTFSSVAHNVQLLKVPCVGEELMFPLHPDNPNNELFEDVAKATKTDFFRVVNVTHTFDGYHSTAIIFVTPHYHRK